MNQRIDRPVSERTYGTDILAREHGVFLLQTKNGDWNAYEVFSGHCIRRGNFGWVQKELQVLGARVCRAEVVLP